MPYPNLPPIGELTALVKSLKKTIGDEYRSSAADPDDTAPSMDLTIGHNPETGGWSYQTGDNSFTGGAYSHPNWAMTTLTRRCNSRDIALDLRNQLDELATF